MNAFYNPYSGTTFFEFLYTLIHRFFLLLSGNFSFHELATDEIQIFVLCCLAASAALIGAFLVLRKMTMLANSLSHTILLGIVIAFFFNKDGLIGEHAGINMQAMLIASLIMGVLTAVLTEFLTKTGRLQEDASTGIVFTSLFALGIVLVTLLTRNAHIGTEAVMGNVDALHVDDCFFVWWIFILNLVLVILFFKEYKITTFDPGLARTLGFSTVFFNYLLMVQASLTIIGAFRAVGILMVLAFLTGPVLTARLLTHHLNKMIALAVLIGCIESIIGVALSRHILTVYGTALTTSGLVVCVIAAGFVLTCICVSLLGYRDRRTITTEPQSTQRGSCL
jgi:manganese/zinc/iron transport system permease protein